MALKDWKKGKGSSDKEPFWINSEQKTILTYRTWTPYGRDGHWIQESGTNWPLTTFWKKNFKTKTEALKYAKAYMSKN